MTAQRRHRCKECQADAIEDGQPAPRKQRPAPYPGPRCATHHRARRRAVSAVQHERSVRRTYDLAPGAYERLYAEQGGRCAICRRATGRTKRLAVDHSHASGIVRGLLCSPCNRMVGYLRDDPEAFRRAASYLEHPPAARAAARALRELRLA